MVMVFYAPGIVIDVCLGGRDHHKRVRHPKGSGLIPGAQRHFAGFHPTGTQGRPHIHPAAIRTPMQNGNHRTKIQTAVLKPVKFQIMGVCIQGLTGGQQPLVCVSGDNTIPDQNFIGNFFKIHLPGHVPVKDLIRPSAVFKVQLLELLFQKPFFQGANQCFTIIYGHLPRDASGKSKHLLHLLVKGPDLPAIHYNVIGMGVAADPESRPVHVPGDPGKGGRGRDFTFLNACTSGNNNKA